MRCTFLKGNTSNVPKNQPKFPLHFLFISFKKNYSHFSIASFLPQNSSGNWWSTQNIFLSFSRMEKQKSQSQYCGSWAHKLWENFHQKRKVFLNTIKKKFLSVSFPMANRLLIERFEAALFSIVSNVYDHMFLMRFSLISHNDSIFLNSRLQFVFSLSRSSTIKFLMTFLSSVRNFRK